MDEKCQKNKGVFLQKSNNDYKEQKMASNNCVDKFIGLLSDKLII